MQLAGAPFDSTVWWGLLAVEAATLGWAVRAAPWVALYRSGLVNLFAGASVAAWLIWSLTTPADAGFAWHLSGMVSLTLIFGLPLALVGGALALLALHGAGWNDWPGWVPTYMVAVLLPALFAQWVLIAARAWLPRHFVVYVFVNAFLAGGVSALLVALGSVGLLWVGTDVGWARLDATYIRYLPLMFFPEAMFNGLIMVVLVAYKPQWVRSFSDADYLAGK